MDSSQLGGFRLIRDVSGNRELRWLGLAFVGFNVAEYATWIAIIIVAYRAGGSAEAGIIGAVQLVPAALFAPLAATLGDSYSRTHLLVIGYLAQSLTMGLTGAALVLGAPLLIVYVAATAAATAVTMTRPTQGALLPSVVRTPRELVAANSLAGWTEGVSIFVGPFVTGLLLAVSTPGAVFLVMGGVTLASALASSRMSAVPGSRPPEGQAADADAGMLGGLRVVVRQPRPRSVVSVMGGNFLLVGSTDILFVVLAIHILHIGNSGAGFLNAAFGLGGVVGAVLLALVVGRRIATILLLGATGWAVGMIIVGFEPAILLTVVLIVVMGAGRPLVDVSGRVLLQRSVPDALLSRVFGLIEGLSMAAFALGMILVPAALAFLNVRGTLIIAGLLLPALIALNWRRLREITMPDVSDELMHLLRSLPIFAPLPLFSLEQVAEALISVEAPAGAVLIREGDQGDRFYILLHGTVEVTIDGRFIRTMGPGEVFGEIALLRAVPRTATVVAETDAQLYALERADFLGAVLGNTHSSLAAQALAGERLGEPGPPAQSSIRT